MHCVERDLRLDDVSLMLHPLTTGQFGAGYEYFFTSSCDEFDWQLLRSRDSWPYGFAVGATMDDAGVARLHE